jgi:hypothetical protein
MHNIKSLLAILLAIIVSLSLITTILCCHLQTVLAQNANDNNNDNNSDFLTFSNITSGVNISYPSYYQESEGNNLILLSSPLKTVGVTFLTIPFVNMSLDEFTAKRISMLREKLINFDINESRTEELLYNPAQTLLFTYGNEKNMSKAMQAWTIKDNNAYIVTYFADAVLFDTFLPTALKIINSFQLNAPRNLQLQTTVMIANKTYLLKYNITGDGNKLNKITPERDEAALRVDITSNSSGLFIIELPRYIVDSKLQNNIDNFYSVFANGNQNTAFYEISGTNSRLLVIYFNKGTQEIRIEGNRMLTSNGI